MSNFIYNDTGANVAFIRDGKVFADPDWHHIANVEDGRLSGLDGEFLGYLTQTGKVRGERDSMPGAFLRVLGK